MGLFIEPFLDLMHRLYDGPVNSLLAFSLVSICLFVILQGLRARTIRVLPIPSCAHSYTAKPGASWIWGHEKSVFINEPGRAFRQWTELLGKTFRIKAAFGAPDILVLSDVEGISYILGKKIYDYHHSKVVRPRVARLLGKGLGWVEGASEHRRMKRLVMPSLSAENIKAMSEDVRQAALVAIGDLQAHVDKTGASKMNILEFTSRVTLNVIGRVAFLHDFEGGKSKDAIRILSARRKGASAIAEYAGFLTLMLLRRFPILNDLPIFAIQAQGLAKMTIQDGVAREMVKRTQSVGIDTLKGNNDLLSRLMIGNMNEEISTEELYEQISTFVISGHETTTQTLGFTIWELARHPDKQERLRSELESFGREPSYDDFQSKLPYLDAVLKETLRLYPGLPYMERVATKHDVIPLGSAVTGSRGKPVSEVVVQPGQVVLIPIIAIQRCDSIWRNPDDFYPERWLGDLPDVNNLPTGWAHLLAFSDGPRSCIGMRLAIFQYKVDTIKLFAWAAKHNPFQIILSSLMKQFRFRDTGAPISLKIASSLQPWVLGKKEEGPQLPVVVEHI
ncbi:hypothetical protein VNI00_001194 [Paramarasmius palmivorus]|uniref:Cytochrome P450 n=1 Tax=Paramarasmius palmivorus TaxID=297713 RepID=A0AAW0EBC3_9AGAR